MAEKNQELMCGGGWKFKGGYMYLLHIKHSKHWNAKAKAKTQVNKLMMQRPAVGMGRAIQQTLVALFMVAAVFCKTEDSCPGE